MKSSKSPGKESGDIKDGTPHEEGGELQKDDQEIKKGFGPRPEIDNEELLDGLKNQLFTNWKEKERKINLIIKTGNFNASKDNPPWYIILPNQRSKRLWDIFVSLAGVINVLMVAVDVSWNFECWLDDMGPIQIVYTIFTVLLIADIVFTCFTAYLDNKNIYCYDLSIIFNNYVQKSFIPDVMASLPYNQLISFDYDYCFNPTICPTKLPYFLFFLRIMRINKFFELLEKIFPKYTVYIRLTKLFTFIIFLANIAGNIFCGISPTIAKVIYAKCLEEFPASSIDNFWCYKNFTKTNFWNCYFFCAYLGILMTLGTDFLTNTSFEMVFLVFIVIISTITNASIYGNVAVMLANVSTGVSPILREKIDTMTEYMNFMKFDPYFKKQIEDYHLNIWFKQRNMMYDDSFFGDMSRALHTILLLFQYKPPFFKHNKLLPIVSPRFILDMVVLFKPRIYMTNDIIITEGESIIDVFFASANSYCKVYIGGQWVRDLYNGDYFGEIAIFLRSRRRTATILCYKDSDFLIIEGDKLQNLLRNYPEDYVRIKNRAVQTFINSIKYYPSNLFAKLVPNNNLKDYLFRKSIYLEDEEEDEILNQKITTSIDSNDYNDKISQIIDKLTEVRQNLLSMA
jgi:hypothetical protein